MLLSSILERQDSATKEVQNQSSIPIRPPYGHITPALLNWSKKSNLKTVMWDVDPCDYHEDEIPQSVAHRIIEHARKGSIILLHDRDDLVATTSKALEEVLSTLGTDGWQFPNLDFQYQEA